MFKKGIESLSNPYPISCQPMMMMQLQTFQISILQNSSKEFVTKTQFYFQETSWNVTASWPGCPQGLTLPGSMTSRVLDLRIWRENW